MTVYSSPPAQDHLVLHRNDVLNVNSGGSAEYTQIQTGGIENVFSGGQTAETTLHGGGTLNLFGGGVASTVRFVGPGAHVNVTSPNQLPGIETNFRNGDIIDFVNTVVLITSVHEVVGHHNLYDVYLAWGSPANTTVLRFENPQPHASFTIQLDGHGGTELIMSPLPTSLVGIADTSDHGHGLV